MVLIQVTNHGYDIWSDIIYVEVNGLMENIYEEDYIELYGEIQGLHTYDTQIGGSNTVPMVKGIYWKY